MVLFKLGEKLSLAVINRRLHKKDAEKDVLEKVTLIKDINIPKPHRAHIEILFDLTIEELRQVHKFTNFVELHEAWKKTLDTKELNKRFYKELSNWYFWAIKEVYFPGAPFQAMLGANAATDPQVREHNAKNLIRLLTRLLFVWFVKEKNLVPDQLFDKRFIKDSLLNGFDPAKTSTFDDHAKASRYYRAVLQNLFFASLNQVVGKREFRKQGQHMNVTNLMRYESYFKDPQAFVALIDNVVPFMNGGLFECLDKPDPQKKGKQGGEVIIYEDGFSDRADNTLCVPDYIFFSNGEHADLSSELDDKKQSNVTVRGLINILNDYKFTVTENTPIEEDIALDPELLGRVFENLLASYNPETKTTARKQTGSFYTPREIVDYMVDESLKAYLKQKLVAVSGMKAEDADVGLNILFSYTEKEHAFNNDEKHVLIEAIDACKVLDPACGSGAFPMGILHKLVLILHKLDPDNVLWREQQRQNAIKETENAFRIGNQEERDNRLKDISDVFENNAGDFGRKLYLIESCIYGVDIQPIATQISKLRFFISLIVDQQSNTDKAHNYGVIPLPNLESKFVAANSLIGLKKPEHQINCFDNQAVKNIEEQIQQVRHKLFSAKTPATKRRLREEYDALRKQLRDLLIKNGLGNDTAHQLSAWDPYDQNASSPFFDMEWMFGIENGFDICIGNPPYGVSIKGEDREKIISFLSNVPDFEIYYFFIQIAHQVLKKGGINSYIIPNTFLFNVFAAKFRIDLLLRWEIKLILDCTSFKIFDAATIYNVITVFIKNTSNNKLAGYKVTTNALSFSGLINEDTVYIPQAQLLSSNKNWGLIFKLTNEVLHLISVIREKSIELSELFPEYSQGLIAYDKYRGQSTDVIKNRVYHFNNYKTGLKRWLWGEDVCRYSFSWNGKEWIDYCTGIANPRNPKFFQGSRVLIREITNPTIYCAYTDEEYYHDPSVIVVLDNGFMVKYLLCVLNSKLASFYHFNSSPKATKGAFPKILIDDIKSFPLKAISQQIKEVFDRLSDYVVFLIKTKTKVPYFEELIDALVFELYFPEAFRAAGIEIIKHLFEIKSIHNMSDSEKLYVIRNEYDRFNDNKHPVRRNMNNIDYVDEVRIISNALK